MKKSIQVDLIRELGAKGEQMLNGSTILPSFQFFPSYVQAVRVFFRKIVVGK